MYLLFCATIVQGNIQLFELRSQLLWKAQHFCFDEKAAHDSEQFNTIGIFLYDLKNTTEVALLSKIFLKSIISYPRTWL